VELLIDISVILKIVSIMQSVFDTMQRGGGFISSRRRSTHLLYLLAILSFLITTLQLSRNVEQSPSSLRFQGASNSQVPFSRRVPLRTDNNSTFSACLLVMDDNHYLIECKHLVCLRTGRRSKFIRP
jgi:hypothetical protein